MRKVAILGRWAADLGYIGDLYVVRVSGTNPGFATPDGPLHWRNRRDFSGLNVLNSLKSVSLRYFNAAGADPGGTLGERHEPETHLIPLVLSAASGARPDIKVFGRDYDTFDGTCIRDYVHVIDFCQAHLLALQCLLDSDAFNLGNGNGFSVQEVIAAAERVTGRRIPAVTAPRRAGDRHAS